MLFSNFNVFIDGGGNLSSLQKNYLTKFFPNFHKVFVFEPNPMFYDSYKDRKLTFIPKAIWTENCKKTFYLSKDNRQVGSSLLSDKLCRVNNKLIKDFSEKPILVQCVDFSEWLSKNVKPYYNVVLKLDIEGAEYDVLWHLIRENTIKYIKKLYVEFHLEHLPVKSKIHHELINKLKSIGLNPLDWQ